MECNKVQEKLSALIDGILSQDEKMLVEEHLKSCEKCREVLSELKKTIGHIKNQEEIEPPSWLTQKVMVKIRAEAAPKKGLFEKLFYPLHIKLPLGAVATIAIAVTTSYIFKSIQPEIQLANAPSEEIREHKPQPPLIAGDEVTKQSQMQKDNIAASKDKAASPKPALREKTELSKIEGTKPAPSKSAEQPITDKETETTGKYLKAQKAPAPVMKEDKAIPSAGAFAEKALKREAQPLAPKLKVLEEENKGTIGSALQYIKLEKIISEKHPNGSPGIIITYKVTSTGRHKIMEQRFNENGERHGIQKEYYDSGQLKAEVEYNYGELAWYMEFHPDGVKKIGKSKKDWLWLNKKDN